MLLNDIGSTPTATLRKINQHLETNYGFKITESFQAKDISSIMETIGTEITELKLKGDDARSSPEISKRLLILEGLETLREYAIMQMQTPKKALVISALIDGVINDFHRSDDFEKSFDRAMDTYRSSEFRFPDSEVEEAVRSGAYTKLKAPTNSILGNDGMNMMEEESDDSDESGEQSIEEARIGSAADRHAAEREFASQAQTSDDTPRKVLSAQEKWDAALAKQKADRAAGIVHAPAVKKTVNKRFEGTNMRENRNLVKQLRHLLETEVSQAEVMMAAKGFAEELQEMVEKIGRLQNEDLPPVTDQMRETYGTESAAAFQTQIYGALQSVMDSLYTAKDQVDDAVSSMATTGQVSASSDMDMPMGDDGMGGLGDGGMDPSLGGDDMGADLDNIGDEGDMAPPEEGDEFGGAESEDPLGRAMKESILQRKVMEMKQLVSKARRLKESKK